MIDNKIILIFLFPGQAGEPKADIYLIDDAPDWIRECHHHFFPGPDDEINKLIDQVSSNLCEEWASMKVNLAPGEWVELGPQERLVITGTLDPRP